MKLTKLTLVAALTLVLGTVSIASADMFETTAGGWSITADFSGDPTGDFTGAKVIVDQETDDLLIIEIVKIFSGDPGLFGTMPSIYVNFDQIAPDEDTVQKIIINDENVLNDMSVPWTDYHMVVDALPGSGAAAINVGESAGFSVDPFTLESMTDHRLDLIGGPVNPGDRFRPGAMPVGTEGGLLSIDVDLTTDNEGRWFIKQWPTPEPASMLVLGLGGLVTVLRRRR